MKNRKQLLADLMILLVTLSWGVSYYMMDVCLTEMGTFTLNAYRFGLAFLIAYMVLHKNFKKIPLETVKYGAILGVIVTIMYVAATEAVKYTTLTNIGFLIALNVIIIPIMEFLLSKERPDKKLIFVVLFCFMGIALLTLNEDFSMSSEHLLGNILCLVCAFACSLQIIIIGRTVKKERVNAMQLGIVQLGFTGLYFIVLAFAFESPALPQTEPVWISMIFLSLVCTGIAFIVQPVAQQYTTPSHTGVLFSLEPVFAAVAAYFLAGEVLATRGYVGALIMFSSIIIMETDIENIFKKVRKAG